MLKLLHSTQMHWLTNSVLFFTAINGFMYGNLPGLNICQGNKVNWYTIGFGNEVTSYFYETNSVFC